MKLITGKYGRQLMDFNHCDDHWKGDVAGHKQSRTFLQCIEGNVLTYMEKLTRGDALLDLKLQTRKN